jgi:site-specific recombinase XerD
MAEDIIDKYKTHPYCLKYKKLLPVNSNQRYNTYLSEIAAICGLEIDVTTHTARHTFATTIAIEHDIPIKIVSKMLGHKSIRTTEIYARASELAISRHMLRLHDTLFSNGRDLLVDGQSYSFDATMPNEGTSKKIVRTPLLQHP